MPPPPLVDLELDELLTLGNDPSGDPEELLGRPRFVRTGAGGEIYVADEGPIQIKVYDRQGQLLRAIGRRGREPGWTSRRWSSAPTAP